MKHNVKEDFHWLLGVWKTSDGQSIYEEWWIKDENILTGFRYKLQNGIKQEQEKFRLAQHDDRVYYFIFYPDSGRSHQLQMNFVDDGMAVFENLEKTYPEFIRYKLTPKNILLVSADGSDKTGKRRRIQYPFAKVS